MSRRKRKNSHKLSRKRWMKWRVLSMGLYGKRQDHPAWKSYRSYLAYNNRYFKEDALPGDRSPYYWLSDEAKKDKAIKDKNAYIETKNKGNKNVKQSDC